jgi:hypothetical protein
MKTEKFVYNMNVLPNQLKSKEYLRLGTNVAYTNESRLPLLCVVEEKC